MATILNTPPLRFGAARAGDTDTRGVNFTDVLSPVSDTITSITSVTAARRDGVTSISGDLAISPSGAPVPWTSAVAFGPAVAPGLFVNWWQQSGATIANAAPVDYKITITAVSTNGRIVVHDYYQLVVSGLG